MDKTRERIVEDLKTTDHEFRQLWDEHQDLKRQLADIDAKPRLTPNDEMEIKRLKKIKLAGKDKMEARILRAMPAAS